MTPLNPGTAADAAGVSLAHEPLPASDIRAGTPSAGALELGAFGGAELGVWEMTPGVAADVESDEVFVVLSGRARIEFESPALPSVDIGPGSVMRLASGMRTVWTVTETLRKVYLTR
ncbi:cupin domain-containing protein [Microbacterium sp.]|uniref:cupin domain-containing protein n=1 Tax=Microbacterium sp. TaxID=51671 RepID=UPI002812021C|nr:cupin domain-containing protein [Microbacterium sp.]